MGIESMTLVCEKSVYYAGENINGHCTVVVKKPMELPVIHMRFEGFANVSWSESRTEYYTDSDGQSQSTTYTGLFDFANLPLCLNVHLIKHTEWYSSHEELVCIYRDLVVQGGSFQPGTYSLPFTIDTPRDLISSFEGAHGSVRYYVEANKNNNFGLFSRKVKTYVCILQPIDVNMYLFPVSGADTKTICCGLCASGPLTIEAKCDRGAYSPGENVLITARFENQSEREVRPYVRLLQQQVFYAQGSRNFGQKSYDLVPITDQGETTHKLGEGGVTTWDKLAFPIPPCYPSLKCQIIDVSYYLEVCLDIPMAFDLRVSLPLVMATIPFRETPQVVTVQPSSSVGWKGFGSQSGQKLEKITAPPITSLGNNGNVDTAPPTYFQTIFSANAEIAHKADNEKADDKTKTAQK